MDPTPGVRPGWKRKALVALGLVLVGLGYLGVLLPGLPTTPFLLGASYCFIRSSPRLHAWLRRSPVLGRVLADWETHRGIRPAVKVLAVSLVIAVVTASIAFGGLPVWTNVLIGCLAVVGVMVILSVRTVGAEKADEMGPGLPSLPRPPSPKMGEGGAGRDERRATDRT